MNSNPNLFGGISEELTPGPSLSNIGEKGLGDFLNPGFTPGAKSISSLWDFSRSDY
jgi:hypothetical protein